MLLSGLSSPSSFNGNVLVRELFFFSPSYAVCLNRCYLYPVVAYTGSLKCILSFINSILPRASAARSSTEATLNKKIAVWTWTCLVLLCVHLINVEDQ